MAEQRPNRGVYVVLDVPELDFIPDSDREGMSSSAEGVLTNKIFKYAPSKEAGRIIYAKVIDRYGLSHLVREKGAKQSRTAKDYRNALQEGEEADILAQLAAEREAEQTELALSDYNAGCECFGGRA